MIESVGIGARLAEGVSQGTRLAEGEAPPDNSHLSLELQAANADCDITVHSLHLDQVSSRPFTPRHVWTVRLLDIHCVSDSCVSTVTARPLHLDHYEPLVTDMPLRERVDIGQYARYTTRQAELALIGARA